MDGVTTGRESPVKASYGGVTWALALAVLFAIGAFVEVDTRVSALFFRDGLFVWQLAPLAVFLHDLVRPLCLLVGGLLAATTLVTWHQGRGWRRWAFLLLALILGPGLVTNTLLKDHWGRARPEHTLPFGGDKPLTPALIPARSCASNCSFVAGDPAFGFWFSAFAYIAVRRRRALFWSGIALGAGLGILRIGMGAHFFSDVIFSGLINLAVFAALYRVMFGAKALSVCWRDFRGISEASSASPCSSA